MNFKDIFQQMVSGSEIRVSTLAICLLSSLMVYLFIILFAILTKFNIPELNMVLESLKIIIGIFSAGVIGNGMVSVGKGFVDAKSGMGTNSGS